MKILVKKLIPVFLFVLLLSGCKKENAQESFADIKDPAFLTYVLTKFDKNQDYELSEDEVAGVEDIYCVNLGIKSLRGIGLFRNLRTLNCSDNSIITMDVSRNMKLEKLVCEKNNLQSLNIGKNGRLITLDCSNTMIKELNVQDVPLLRAVYVTNCPMLNYVYVRKGQPVTFYDLSAHTQIVYK